MTIYRCHMYGKPGYQSGKKGKCYLYNPNSPKSQDRAKERATDEEKLKKQKQHEHIHELLGWFRNLYT